MTNFYSIYYRFPTHKREERNRMDEVSSYLIQGSQCNQYNPTPTPSPHTHIKKKKKSQQRSLQRLDNALLEHDTRFRGVLECFLGRPFGPDGQPQRAFVLLP